MVDVYCFATPAKPGTGFDVAIHVQEETNDNGDVEFAVYDSGQHFTASRWFTKEAAVRTEIANRMAYYENLNAEVTVSAWQGSRRRSK